jgi:periplasmic protein CpxP/Spy
MKLYPKQIALTLAAGASLLAAPLFAQTDAPPPPPAPSDAPPPPPPDGGHFRGGPGRGNPERRVEMLQQHLGLSADQTTQVKALLETERGKMEALRSNSSVQGEDRRTQMMAIHQDTNTKMHAILTPEQATKYDAMEARMREHPHGPPPAGAPPAGAAAPSGPGER